MAVSKSDQFDFLIDIVPRDEAKPTKKEEPTRAALMDPAQLYMMQPVRCITIDLTLPGRVCITRS
jgi:hypothetical protein